MVKYEIKVEFSNTDSLKSIIEKAYFIEGDSGKIIGKDYFLEIDKEKDDVTFTILKGLHNATVKITNNEIIEGSMRFLIDESQNNIRISPISIYCIKEEGKYIFY
jgi:hypothetical protein